MVLFYNHDRQKFRFPFKDLSVVLLDIRPDVMFSRVACVGFKEMLQCQSGRLDM